LYHDEEELPMTPQRSDWEHLAKAACEEFDSKKLMELIEELTRTLAQNDKPAEGLEA
jgi:hypothetical protein